MNTIRDLPPVTRGLVQANPYYNMAIDRRAAGQVFWACAWRTIQIAYLERPGIIAAENGGHCQPSQRMMEAA